MKRNFFILISILMFVWSTLYLIIFDVHGETQEKFPLKDGSYWKYDYTTLAGFKNLDTDEKFNVMSHQMIFNCNAKNARKFFCIKVKPGQYCILDFSVPQCWLVTPSIYFEVMPGVLNYIGSLVVGETDLSRQGKYIYINDEREKAVAQLLEKYPNAQGKEIIYSVAITQ